MKLAIKLEPSDLEDCFRQEGLRRDIKVSSALLLIAIVFHLVSLLTDFKLLGESDALYFVWGIRGVSAVIAGVILVLLRRHRGVAFFDNTIFTWAVLLMIGVVAANSMFPRSYTTHVSWDLLLVLAVYALVPLSFSRQVTAALIITVGDIVLFAKFKILEQPGTYFDIFTAFVCANVLGSFASWELQRWRRQQFKAFQREADARSKLERALFEIKTLKGIIPICANCKNIRTDEGHWRQLEAYIRDHSDADFTHGICPECQMKLYPNLDKPV